jgi:broad specificity phosphatase PhoE
MPNSDIMKEFTDLGYIQSKLLGRKLSKIKFNEVIISDLNRTRLTGEEILKHNNVSNVHYEELIREKNGGVLEGKPQGINHILAKVSRNKNLFYF